MDEEAKKEWEKSKRIEAEKMKAARNLAQHEEKANLAYMPIVKARGFSRDPNVIAKSAERMANISIVFAPLGILFGIFMQLFNIVADVNKLGLAGSGIMMIFSAVHGIGIGVAVITGIVALACAIIFAHRTKFKVKPTIITASISLILIVLYYIIRSYML